MKKEDKIQDLVQDFEPSSNKDAMNIKTCMEKKERKGENSLVLGLQTKANGELNSPAAVQAALVIPWKARAENDTVEVCHRASTLS